jgi:hypothetical protein
MTLPRGGRIVSTEGTPRTWTLVECEGCGELLGVQDHLRIRSEHNDLADHCGQRPVEVIALEPVLDLLERALVEIGTDAEGAPWPVSREIEALLRAHGRLKGDDA